MARLSAFALVKHILNRHGGRLTIASVYGQGASFIAVQPLALQPVS